MKKIIYLLISCLVFIGCSTSSYSKDSKVEFFKIPIILIHDDAPSNDSEIKRVVRERVIKNSIFSGYDEALADKDTFYVSVDTETTEQYYGTKYVEVHYINYLTKNKITAVFPTRFKPSSDGRFLRVYIEKQTDSNYVLKYSSKLEEDDDFDVRDIAESLENGTCCSKKYKNSSFSPTELLSIHKDIVNLHNKYIPVRQMVTYY